MNFSFDWGAVIVAGVGAAASIIVMKADMRWIKEALLRNEKNTNTAHARIDDLILNRSHTARMADREVA